MRRTLLVVLAATSLAAPAAAGAYSNGQIPGSQLAPIYNPAHAPHQVLAKANGAASAWNTLNLGLFQMHKPLLRANGDGAAYRCLSCPGFSQQYAWQHSPSGYAAFPGTSRHGDGWALDLFEPSWSRYLLDRYGPALAWSWYRPGSTTGWVDYEPWHVEFHGHYGRPDPGVSPAHADLKLGSGGRYQSLPVAQVQRRLQNLRFFPHRVTGQFAGSTRLAVYTYQVARGFKHPTGTVTRNTWIALRQHQAGRKAAAARAHATAKLAGLKHGDRGPAVSQLSRDLAFVRHHNTPGLNFYHGPVLKFFTVGLAGALRAWQTDNKLSATAVYDLQSQKLMATSLRYWHKRFPAVAVKPGKKQPPPPAEHPAPRPAPAPAPSGSTLWADISGNNSSVNLAAYRASRHILIAIKLTEGNTFRSDTAASRWKQAGQLGLIRLAYDFARPSQNSCTSEANNFAGYAKQVGWHRGDIAVLDWEDPGFEGHNGNAWVVCWARRLAALHVRAGVVYSYGSYIAGTLNSTHGLAYWHAVYGGTISASTAPTFARNKLIAIQFTDGDVGAQPHSVGGIHGDVNKLVVPVNQLLALAQK